MTRLLSSIALVLCLATTASGSDKKNPADFPLTVHVLTSGSYMDSHLNYTEYLEVTLGGKPMRLESPARPLHILVIADYPAKVDTPNSYELRHAKAYEVSSQYDLLMPDGSVRHFDVTRLGPAVPVYPPSN